MEKKSEGIDKKIAEIEKDILDKLWMPDKKTVQHTKEMCKKACKQKIEQQESPDGLYLYEIEQAIDSAEIK